MGKQASFYMEREVFAELAQTAIDHGCIIIRKNANDEITMSRSTNVINTHSSEYYFYLPAAGSFNSELPLGCYNANANVMIEAGYTVGDGHTLFRGRLYLASGFTDADGKFIERPDCLAKVYRSLVHRMKQLTDFIDVPAGRICDRLNNYSDTSDRSRKVYMTRKLQRLMSDPKLVLA